MIIWRLSKGADRRFRQGHPWIFASELNHSAKEIKAGDLIELHDSQGHFLAYGYGHPSSQICFRRLSSRSKDKNVLSTEFFIDRLKTAREFRKSSGWADVSHRWLFAESDGVPGLIVDAFKTKQGWIAVAQASTAGMDRALPQVFEALESFAAELGGFTIVEAPSSKARAMEGLKVGEKRVVSGKLPDPCTIQLRHDLELNCDILGGQKTGFFLDQQWNASLLREFVSKQFAKSEKPVRVLDICCYVGQWAAHTAHALKQAGSEADVTLFDASATALELATQNLKPLSHAVNAVKGDALESLSQLEAGTFDIVICDPPAFVKKKADLLQGTRAYVKVNAEAQRRMKAGGLYVASSCSGLVKSEEWQEILIQSSQKSSRTFKQLAKGGHAPDHPVRAEFPEGEYLKCSIGRIEYPF